MSINREWTNEYDLSDAVTQTVARHCTEIKFYGYSKNTWKRILEKEDEKLKMSWKEIGKQAQDCVVKVKQSKQTNLYRALLWTRYL